MDVTILRTCLHCKEGKTYKQLVKDKRKTDGIIAVCNACATKMKKENPSYSILKGRMRTKYKDREDYADLRREARRVYHLNNLEHVMHTGAKIRARRSNLEFNIEYSDIVIPGICPLLEIPIFRGTNIVKGNSPSLDRIDTTKGYIKGNVRVISYKANTMKNDASPETLRMFIRNLERYLLDNDIV